MKTIALQYRVGALLLSISCLGMLCFGGRLSAQPSDDVISPAAETLIGFAQPLQPPALLENALIWRPLGEAALIYSAWDNPNTQQRYDWLRGLPLTWSAYPHPEGAYLLWRTTEDALWLALLGANGEQRSAPIAVTLEPAHTYRAASLFNDLLLVAWLSEAGLNARLIDPAGRPLPIQDLVQGRISHLALGRLADGSLYLAWALDDILYSAPLSIDNASRFSLGDSTVWGEVPLGEGQWLASLDLLNGSATPIILLSAGDIAQPDSEKFFILDTDPAEKAFQTLAWAEAEALRWPTVHPQRAEIMLAAWREDTWEAVRLSIDAEGAYHWALIEGEAVTGSPIGAYGERAAWVTLDASQNPRLYLHHSAEMPEPTETQNQPNFLALIAPLLWLIWPCGILWGLEGRWFGLPIALAGYWLAKILLPFGLSASLSGLSLLGALALINILAVGLGGVGWGQRSNKIPQAAYFLTEALLTFAIWGGSLE